MFEWNAGKLAKTVMDGLQKGTQLPELSEKLPEQAVALLKNLLPQAEKMTKSSPDNQNALNAIIQKGKALLESKDISLEAVTELTAELSARMKEAKDAPKDVKPSTDSTPVTSAVSSNPANQPASIGGSAKRTTSKSATAATAAASAQPKSTEKSVNQFSDLDSSAYYYKAVQWAVRQGIASGMTETRFGPEEPCTRAQTVTFLWRAAGSPKPKSQKNPFTDLSEKADSYHAVLWAVERGITSGTEDGTFHPDETVTRAQVATFLYRNAGSPAVQNRATFTDVPSDSYYYHAVSWVAEKGITSGTTETTFSPDSVCTRGQILTFLYRCK